MTGLAKQTIVLDFGFGGLDQKSDPKRVISTKLLDVNNARFNKVGLLERRVGFEEVGTISNTVIRIMANDGKISVATSSVTTPALVQRISTSGESFTVANGPSVGPRYNTMPAGEIVAQRISEARSSNYLIEQPPQIDRADSTNYYCIVQSGLASIYDRTTNILCKSEAIMSSSTESAGTRHRVIAHPLAQSLTIDNFVIAVDSTTQVRYFTFSNTSALTAVAGMATESVSGAKFDLWACADATQSLSAMIFTASSLTAGINLRRSTWPTSGGVGSALSETTVASGLTVSKLCIANSHNPSDTTMPVRLFWCETVAGLRTATYNHSLTVVLASGSVTSTTTAPITMTGCQLSDGMSHLIVQYTGTPSFLRSWSVNSSNTVTLNLGDYTLYGTVLNSKAAAKSGDAYCQYWGGYAGSNQETMFLYASSAGLVTAAAQQFANRQVRALGRAFHTNAQGNIASTTVCGGVVANMQCIGSEFVTVALEKTRIVTAAGVVNNKFVVSSLKHRNDRGWLYTKSRNETVMTGGFLSVDDGVGGTLPAGPQLFPVVTVSATTGSNMVAGVYAVSGIFEYKNSSGRVYRSAPATPVNVTLTTTQAVRIGYDAYAIPDEISQDVQFVPYRTLVNESQVFYRSAALTGGDAGGGNIGSATSVTSNLDDTDANMAASEPLYTAGGVYENWQPSAPIAVASNGRRVLVVTGDRPTFVVESKPIDNDANGLSFFESVGREIAPCGNRIYALASYLDRWFAFKEAAVFVAQGDGADVTGQNDTLSEFQQLSNGLGTTQPRSVVTTSVGVVFRSERGFYLIGGSLDPVYIGDAVEDYTSAVKDAAYDEDNDLVHFTLEDGTELVLTIFETAQGHDIRWSVDGTFALNGSAAVNGVRYIALAVPNGSHSLYKQRTTANVSLYLDGQSSSTAIPDFNATTSWVNVGDIQSFGRLYHGLVMGTLPTAQQVAGRSTTVTIQVGYDGNTSWTETHTISSADFELNGETAQFRFSPQRTKFEMIRFRISQSIPSNGDGGYKGFSLNQIKLIVGVKPPDNKIKSSARARKS